TSAYIVQGKRPQTKISLSSNQFDLGKIERGEGKYFKIDFKNIGKTGLLIKEITVNGVPFFYSCGYQYKCCNNDFKPFVGNNEIIRIREEGSILLKLGKTDLELGKYKSTVKVSGNFESKVIKLKFEVVNGELKD